MLNINQNFDLKAPVFNFDRDYFNSVDELNAYDTSNVPNHFVTNVAGMLYQFTDGKWLPMIGTTLNDPDDPDSRIYHVNLLNDHCHVYIDPDNDNYIFNVEAESSNASMDSDGAINLYTNDNTEYPFIDITKEFGDVFKNVRLGVTENESFGLTLQNTENNGIQILTDKQLTDEEQGDGYCPVDLSLIHGDYSADINAKNGFTHKTDDGFVMLLNGYGLGIKDATGYNLSTSNNDIRLNDGKYNAQICLHSYENSSYLYIGSDEKFKLSRSTNDEGGVISGIKSLTAFANPSATKVWATDGSTVDLSTKANASDLDAKANTSDVLLKKSTSGGYYIEANTNELGEKAFAANNTCTASGENSFAEGFNNKALSQSAHVEGESNTASGARSHAEGLNTIANAICAHSEGYNTKASGYYSHAEGRNTTAAGYSSHAYGAYNVINRNSIHSVGIGNSTTSKNAEYIYILNNDNGNNLIDDPKNGYKYLIGVGGYDGISTDNTTYKSVQEVIADLTARIEQLETKVKALEDANAPA